MRQQLSNTIYGLLDYGAYPIGMLAVAPVILRNLGVSQYGVWTVATSVVSFGSIVSSGFGDANIQKVATHRGDGSGPFLLRVAQYVRLQQLLKVENLLPSFDLAVSRDLLRFGVFTWLSAAAGVLFSQGDRLIGGASMGASAFVAYALCAQISQPVYGLTASGLHFLFPYLASRRRTSTPGELRKIVKLAFVANGVLVLTGTGAVLTGSNWILHLLANDVIASACVLLLPSVLGGSAIAALSVTGTYAMFALGRVRFVALTNVGGALASAGVVACFVHGFGVRAIIAGRFAFALVALLVYVPLLRELRIGSIRIDGLAANGPAVEEA